MQLNPDFLVLNFQIVIPAGNALDQDFIAGVLGAIIGDKPQPRTEIMKKVWVYIKKNSLQDKAKKTMINADAKLREVLGKAQVSMFEMTKLVNKHLS